jgi:hypothetical protein
MGKQTCLLLVSSQWDDKVWQQRLCCRAISLLQQPVLERIKSVNSRTKFVIPKNISIQPLHCIWCNLPPLKLMQHCGAIHKIKVIKTLILVQRSVYKDLVVFLQEDRYLSIKELKNKVGWSVPPSNLVSVTQALMRTCCLHTNAWVHWLFSP